MVLGIHNIQLLAHHGRIQRALDLAQFLIPGHAVANTYIFYALGNVLVGGVLCDSAHLLTALGLGALRCLHVGAVVLLRRWVLGMRDGAWISKHVS
jgi:hypothetical protein